MRKIILADGQEFAVSMCGAADGVLWIRFVKDTVDFPGLVQVFSDPEKTCKIVHTYDFEGMETEYDNYTELINIHITYEKEFMLALRFQEPEQEET